ncbi:MAG: hypothetical protein K6F88_08705 [Ruminococcus sp.]|nr:hypothetical protein [Ruminococcus sp.]
MAKSKIIRDLANGDIDIHTALKRAKVLFDEFQNDDIKQWINNELTGYSSVDDLPVYRVHRGSLVGTFIIGRMKYTNASIPIGKMPDNSAEVLLSIYITESICTIIRMIEEFEKSNSRFGKPIDADTFPIITKYNGNPYMRIISANVIGNSFHLNNIVSIVENKLLEALLFLEKEFGVLDELDIDTSNKSADEMKAISDKIVFIFNDNSINIGDNNSIKNSKIK